MADFKTLVENSIPVLDLSQFDLPAAHTALGREVAGQVQKVLAHHLKGKPEKYARKIKRIASHRLKALERVQESAALPALLREAAGLYLECLNAWAQSSRIADAGPGDCTPLEIALFLQEEDQGCQSGAYRSEDGSILFWHTEEDVDEKDFKRVDLPRLMRFASPFGKSEIHSFIYPDLLPGPNFNWRSDGFVQFADTLYSRKQTDPDGISANCVAWLSLMLGGLLPLPELIRQLQPIHQGYALFNLAPRNDPTCTRIEFTADQMIRSDLGDAPCSKLLQTNAFSTEAGEMAAKFGKALFPSLSQYEKRIQRAEKCLAPLSGEVDLPLIQRMLASREGGNWAFANKDVKAHLFGRLSNHSLEIHSHPGMAEIP